MGMKFFKFFVIGLFGIFTLQSCGEKVEDKTEEVYLPLVKVWKAEKKTFEHKIKVQGTVETDQDVLLNAEMGGLVTRVHVQEGQSVRAGQVLISLDGAVLASNANEIREQLKYAEFLLSKQEQLKSRGLGTEFDYESAKSQVTALNARLRSVNVQQGKSSVVASFSGVVDKIYAKDGQVVGPQNPLIRLVNNNNVDITADLSEKHFSAVKMGTNVQVTFPNYSDTMLNLVVKNVGQYIEPVNRTFRIVTELNNNRIFLPNMLAELSITDMQVENALVIASKGIMKDQNNDDFIYVATSLGKDKYSIRKVGVKVIERMDGEAYIQVTSDKLEPGELVVTEGAKGITEKDTVRIRK